MGFELDALRDAVARHGRVVRVVIAAVRGSSPREVGAAMLVWDGGQSGTIGGGTLEFQAAQAARAIREPLMSHHALGPDMGQCCGGAVSLFSEPFDAAAVATLDETVIARPTGPVTAMPLSVKRVLDRQRAQGVPPAAQLLDGWMIEPVHRAARPVWIWGAGHVGRALVGTLSPIPDLSITWIDTARDRFPPDVPAGVDVVPARQPGDLVAHAPRNAEHLIVTYSHALDLDLCHRLLVHGFGFAGLIGSRTKWARFRSRLAKLGHSPERIGGITCPIGDPSLGKHPQSIAIGVAARLLRPATIHSQDKDLSA
ncbi:xanthine dehydrogenase accessory protein XdhC [Sedimentitalea sp. JM2-8]|uniref:Xanthine dehydrogenase accessory protein XdhC n=1 Tax=Sedimentitalea xiamensis TaxID=3050037 RepID=A0ABT7FFU4_9RHOB|nr:xanthine dehydrogenase accessory protein XdhC [Sedimentitalea xiamensis]MDK3073987.1 xanthine dehydrogenase accessory protein XdhC [Sedimentitalea xiamensis]